MTSFSELGTAQKMRDWVKMMITKQINILRPADQPGVILSISKTGASFPIGDGSEGQPPPESAGNPANLYYAQVRLDNGEIVTARIAQDVPIARSASWFDTTGLVEGELGSDEYWLIADGVYRRKTTQTITDPDTGIPIEQVVPDVLLPSEPPYVPPRVMVSGTAGRYVITQVIRGMTGRDDFVELAPREVAKDAQDGLRIHSNTITWCSAGWVGNTAFKGDGTYEGEITNGAYAQKFRFNLSRIHASSLDKWHYVEPYQENRGSIVVGAPASEGRFFLLIYAATDGSVFFYLAQRTILGWEVPTPEDPFKGTLILKRFGSDFVKVPDQTLPGDPPVDASWSVWGHGGTNPLHSDEGINDVPRQGSIGSPVLAIVNQLRSGFSFQGVAKAGGLDAVSGQCQC